MLKKYSRKTHASGQDKGDFGLSYDLQVLTLLKPCSVEEHEDFQAAKESLVTAAAAQTVGVLL
ncbi:hypothetical protein M407DRAFT_245246 [Tulasnella calospora MUT 4182]|uniref:Uncharacterized protein n=1 Tax=Tulasnella calospora MUT 4182 TaxID=1051891 RepID=A0A0C3QB16_9AGAM|nr:hypothetical protein M407DRAFT_245246 [Tulasnella calospora MUT 4182]